MKNMAKPELPVAMLPDGRPVWASDLSVVSPRVRAVVGTLIVLAFVLLLCFAGSADIR